ncbi:toxin co-regulated pilus biosynthesis Q family protein [Methylovorus glucosotrophus]|uniref:Toxin co-regulated pilus biosynthesis protein Q C-terminal domain-containing protein n=1 Tax=Methylovorus glucosotrophus (strain SIP3-4) TaxID=582744 RepID=C6XES8_METGS|nr:toxin co-regulated pilus biosynthesis Q family protein [Methylovorus glucosotrophus]ACT52135.1 hypothetical protein Msip34_2911 [Methylovorus glucosotrophus SIP3-4]
MKRIVFLGFVMNSSMAMAAGQICGDLNEYVVQKVSFSDTTLQSGLIQITNGMPFQIIAKGGNDLRVSALDVSGPLGGVLEKFSKEAGFTYRQNKCLLEISALPPKQTWKIQVGDRISDRFNEWARSSNWTLSWETAEVIAEGNVTYSGSFDEAIITIVDALNNSGSNLKAKFYEANNVLRITERK